MAVFVSHAFVLYYSGALFRYEKYDSILACVKDQAKKLLFPYAMLTIVCAPFWYINHMGKTGILENREEVTEIGC